MAHYPGNGDARQIGCWGMPFVNNQPDSRKAYFAEAELSMDEQRRLCEPDESPIDRLTDLLDQAWPAGAAIQTLDGQRMFAGLVRQFAEGIEARPHLDRLDWAAADSAEVVGYRAQLAANVYLLTSPSGGDLELWNMGLSPSEYSQRRLPESYGLDRKKLPDPTQILSPDLGELILFRADQVHAVTPPGGGMRIAISCFVGYWGESRPLGIWS